MSVAEARAISADLHSLRNPRAAHGTLVYQQNPEAWLESIVRSHLATVDASLVAHPLYGQVPAIAGQNRTVIDLLAVDHSGRLAVLELKAAQDLHLPLQALDYWLRVKWHLDRGEFSRFGYFPGIELRRDPPRLLLIAPSLDFHPSTETILRYLVPEVEVTRIGLRNGRTINGSTAESIPASRPTSRLPSGSTRAVYETVTPHETSPYAR
jgi:hypothetical protein